MQSDCYWTTGYRGGWIHGCYDRSLQREVITAVFNGDSKGHSSVASAKRWIGRKANANQ